MSNEAESASLAAQVLSEAAFGADPARTDLPPATTAVESWHRAVALGAQGYYARAHTELDRLAGLPGVDATLRSLAANTRASWWRQLGWHRRAARWDGTAVRVAPYDGTARYADEDALVGLAADALGQGRLSLAARLLDRGRSDAVPNDAVTNVTATDDAATDDAATDDAATDDAATNEAAEDDDFHALRVRIRWHWVAAEIAMAGGHVPAALAAAQRSVELADAGPSVRHRVKSNLVRAAAGVVAGDADAVDTVARVHSSCVGFGLLPLQWAAALLWAGVADSVARRSALAEAEKCGEELARRGARLRER